MVLKRKNAQDLNMLDQQQAVNCDGFNVMLGVIPKQLALCRMNSLKTAAGRNCVLDKKKSKKICFYMI